MNIPEKLILTFRFRNFSVSRLLPIFEGFGFGEFGLGKKVLVSVSENLVSKKVSVSVSENLVLGKKARFQKI